VSGVAKLLLALLLLAGLDWALEQRWHAPRGADPVIEKLADRERLAGRQVVAVSLTDAGGPTFYVRRRGQWRCENAHRAVCDPSAVEGLIASLLEARGVERARGAGREAAYGLGPDARLVVALHGERLAEDPGRDVLLSVDLGKSTPGGPRGMTFARETGGERVLEIDRDPRALLRSTGGLPPMVDTTLLAGSRASGFGGLKEMRIEREGRVLRVALEGEGWVIERDGRRDPCPPWRAGGFMALWIRGRYEGVESPARAKELGLEAPGGKVVLVPDVGEEVELRLSPVDAGGRAYVWNRGTNVVMVVGREMQGLLLPEASMFLDLERANPWERWLRKP